MPIVYDDRHVPRLTADVPVAEAATSREATPWGCGSVSTPLLERAAKFSSQVRRGQHDCSPSKRAGDVSVYIPQMSSRLPMVRSSCQSDRVQRRVTSGDFNAGISVSCVGSAAQIAMKQVWQMKLELAQFAELEAFSQFA